MPTIEEVIASLSKNLKSTMKVGADIEPEVLPTPSVGLNMELGGGFGFGRINTIFGSKSAGKSSMCLQMVGEAQRRGKTCAWIDAEQAFSASWARELGVDPDNLLVSRAKSLTRAGDEAAALIKGGVDMLVIDSVSALLPDSYFDKDNEELSGMARTAKIGSFSKNLKALLRTINYVNENTLVILISQHTTFIGPTSSFQTKEGGNAINFYSSQVVELKSTSKRDNIINGMIYVGDKILERPIGRKVEFRVEWNKLGRAGGQGNYDFHYAGDNIGVQTIGEMVDIAMEFGVIKRGGAWYTYPAAGDQVFNLQGRDKVIEYLKENPEVYAEIEGALYEQL